MTHEQNHKVDQEFWSNTEDVARAIALFPATFCLYGHGKDQFAAVESASFVSQGAVTLYIYTMYDGKWGPHHKCSPSELRRQINPLPNRRS